MNLPFLPPRKSQLCIRYHLAFPAENEFTFLVTLPELDGEILEYHRLLESLPRSDPNRPTLLFQLAGLRSQRRALSNQKSDLDKVITHLTEAILLPPTQDLILGFFHLAAHLRSRFSFYRQHDDLKSSIKYFRFLRSSFHSLEAFDIPHTSGDLPTQLFNALSYNLVLTPGDMVQDLEEMITLIPEFITADILTFHRKQAIEAFNLVVPATVTEMFCRTDTKLVANRAIQVLQEASLLNPDFNISLTLARCLAARFKTTLAMNDYEDAIAIADRIVATHSPGNSPTMIQRDAMILISILLVSRLNSFSRPDYLEEAVHRIRSFVPCLPDENRTQLTSILNSLMRQRFDYFGVSGNLGGAPPNPYFDIRTEIDFSGGSALRIPQGSQIEEKLRQLCEVAAAFINGEITDVAAAVERSRNFVPLPLQQSGDEWPSSSALAGVFAMILFHAYRSTKRSDYLNEAITTLRDLRKISAPTKVTRFDMGYALLQSLVARLGLFQRREDLEELMQLCPDLANDPSGEVFTRFNITCIWAAVAQSNMHPSASIAYETAMSLLHETLVFCPTLQTQHLRLAGAFLEGGRLPLDYASYQIQNGQVEQAVGTLERGRTLIWSEMRGLRTSTDQLRTADPALADKFADINQRLESVTISVALGGDSNEISRSETGTGSVGHLVLTQRRLLEERNSLISRIQSLPRLKHFLKQPSFDFLNSAASHGPVIIINQPNYPFPSHILLLRKDERPFIITTPSSFHDRANQLENELLRVRKKKGLDSNDYDLTLASVLSDLYELVGKPVVERLRKLKVPEKSRVWWCPTSAFCSLPLHAMGPIPSDDGKKLYFSDLYITSYTPSLSTLIESRKRRQSSDASDKLKPSILLVAQPEALPGALGEITAIEATKIPVKKLISAMATPKAVIEGLREHRFAHFVCHGLLETDKPFDASLKLHRANLTLLAIVRSQLPAAEFAFLSACHTAELTEGGLADEGLHLAAAMQYCGFRSVVGTMWAMADADGADLSRHFYKTIFAAKADQSEVPYHERSARALQVAVKKLRKKTGITLERWVNFVHYGA
jgi:CHAT domain-containing protein/tetratricopeptide (TPR) repeat protein